MVGRVNRVLAAHEPGYLTEPWASTDRDTAHATRPVADVTPLKSECRTSRPDQADGVEIDG